MAVIALDLGGTKLAAAILTNRGNLFHKRVVLLEGRSGKAVGNLICETAFALKKVLRERSWPLTGIAASVPGISDPKTGRVWAPNIPDWEAYPLQRELATKVAVRGIPVIIESDRSCCILGETWRGAARGARDAIYVSVGTGIGAGIILDGKVLNGFTGTAGSIGWLALARPFRAQYANYGCFEYYASGDGLARAARQRKLRLNSGARELFAAYESGNRAARFVIADAIQFWGMAVANLVSLFNPQKIIFGGGVFGPAVVFLDKIRAEAQKWGQPIAMKQVRLDGSSLGADAALYGAAYLALRRQPRTR